MINVPYGMILMGTCGSCGGPVFAPMHWQSTGTADRAPEQCGQCGRTTRPDIAPVYGPIRQMQ